jgi:preprotein translocase subunit YajC
MTRIAAAIFSLFAATAFAQEKPKQEGENFYRECKLGDWVETKGGVKKEVVSRNSVSAKTDDSLTLKIEQTIDGKSSPPIEYKVDLTIPFPPPMKPRTDYTSKQEKLDSGKETLTINGKTYECEWVKTKTTIVTKFEEKETTHISTSKVWSCKDVPLGFPVKVETEFEDGSKSGSEIVDYGRGK